MAGPCPEGNITINQIYLQPNSKPQSIQGLDETILVEELHILHILTDDVKIEKCGVRIWRRIQYNNENNARKLPHRHPVHLLSNM